MTTLHDRQAVNSEREQTAKNTMLPLRVAMRPWAQRFYSTASAPSALLYIEHRSGSIETGSLSALTAAKQLGGSVTGVVVGTPGEVENVAEKATK